MLRGKVLRPPRFDAKLDSLDATGRGGDARRDGGPRRRLRRRGGPRRARPPRPWPRSAPSWKTPPQPSDQRRWPRTSRAPATTAAAGGDQDQGDVGAGAGLGAHRLDASYEVAYIAHAPLEPRAAARRVGGRQARRSGPARSAPSGSAASWPRRSACPRTDVRVIVPDTGSGYGGKHTGEAAIEAARLAKAAGKPVKVVWTREEEFTWAYFRPAGVIDISAAADAGRHADRLGVPQLQLRRLRPAHALRRCPTSATASSPASRRCARARTARWPPPPTTSPASRHMDELARAGQAGPAGFPPERT